MTWLSHSREHTAAPSLRITNTYKKKARESDRRRRKEKRDKRVRTTSHRDASGTRQHHQLAVVSRTIRTHSSPHFGLCRCQVRVMHYGTKDTVDSVYVSCVFCLTFEDCFVLSANSWCVDDLRRWTKKRFFFPFLVFSRRILNFFQIERDECFAFVRWILVVRHVTIKRSGSGWNSAPSNQPATRGSMVGS